MKKLLITTLTMMMIGGTTVKAETNFKPHKECFVMPVLVKVENNGEYEYIDEFETAPSAITRHFVKDGENNEN